MPDNHPTPEEREGLIEAFLPKCAGFGLGNMPRAIATEFADTAIAALSRPQTPERLKPEVGVEEIAETIWNSDRVAIIRETDEDQGPWPPRAGAFGFVEDDAEDNIAAHRRRAQAVLDRLSEAAPPAVEGWRPISEVKPHVDGEWFTCLVCVPSVRDYALHSGEAVRKGDGDWWWANTDSEYEEEIFPDPFPTTPRPRQPLAPPPSQRRRGCERGKSEPSCPKFSVMRPLTMGMTPSKPQSDWMNSPHLEGFQSLNGRLLTML